MFARLTNYLTPSSIASLSCTIASAAVSGVVFVSNYRHKRDFFFLDSLFQVTDQWCKEGFAYSSISYKVTYCANSDSLDTLNTYVWDLTQAKLNAEIGQTWQLYVLIPMIPVAIKTIHLSAVGLHKLYRFYFNPKKTKPEMADLVDDLVDDDGLPYAFQDPVYLELMEHPEEIDCGHILDKSTLDQIEEYAALPKNNCPPLCPLCRETIYNRTPDTDLMNRIAVFKKENNKKVAVIPGDNLSVINQQSSATRVTIFSNSRVIPANNPHPESVQRSFRR